VPVVGKPLFTAGSFGGQPVVLYPLMAPPANVSIPVTAAN
jgi:hypothetical protein